MVKRFARQNRTTRSSRRSWTGRAFAALLACALGAALAVGPVGCAGGEPDGADVPTATATSSFTALDTGMTLTVHVVSQAVADDAANACRQRVLELDELLAPENATSEIARINAASGASTAVSPATAALVAASLDAAHRTGGAFDPTVYPLTSAWGFTTGDHRVPSPDEVAALLPRVGYAAVQVDEAAGTVTLEDGAQIDVGGVAKGFAADELRALLRERDITSALFDLGGNVTALGSKPDGSPWKVGVADPDDPGKLAGLLEVRDATVSTSGAYQRYFEGKDGTRYHHLLDPSTGYPAASDLASASVVGADGAQCDALSTACFVLGLDGALDLWLGLPAAVRNLGLGVAHMKRRASKAELLFAAVVVAVAVGGFAVAHAAGAANPSGHAVATIARDGVAIETIDLDAVKNPYTLRLEDERGVNMVAVEPGRIRVAEADCPDEVCVHTGWIDGPATPIACVPHGLTVTVAREGGDGDGLDAVAR